MAIVTVGAFAVIIAVNVVMAVKAVGTFPGLEPDADRFVAAMEGSGTAVLVPEVGVAVTV